MKLSGEIMVNQNNFPIKYGKNKRTNELDNRIIFYAMDICPEYKEVMVPIIVKIDNFEMISKFENKLIKTLTKKGNKWKIISGNNKIKSVLPKYMPYNHIKYLVSLYRMKNKDIAYIVLIYEKHIIELRFNINKFYKEMENMKEKTNWWKNNKDIEKIPPRPLDLIF